ncbi:hypothetical protein G6O67_005447 [Ophiocordyceps sinensis]|uniref:Uncharacterized protein n=1 Tax=Ophiocordyceps sinensis TaxID=72228 RepID=A0A8H4PRH1_9HYPO|nr:hypothetical protein G6O67_005447 [Ophiocordyceps sinensis]
MISHGDFFFEQSAGLLSPRARAPQRLSPITHGFNPTTEGGVRDPHFTRLARPSPRVGSKCTMGCRCDKDPPSESAIFFDARGSHPCLAGREPIPRSRIPREAGSQLLCTE